MTHQFSWRAVRRAMFVPATMVACAILLWGCGGSTSNSESETAGSKGNSPVPDNAAAAAAAVQPAPVTALVFVENTSAETVDIRVDGKVVAAKLPSYGIVRLEVPIGTHAFAAKGSTVSAEHKQEVQEDYMQVYAPFPNSQYAQLMLNHDSRRPRNFQPGEVIPYRKDNSPPDQVWTSTRATVGLIESMPLDKLMTSVKLAVANGMIADAPRARVALGDCRDAYQVEDQAEAARLLASSNQPGDLSVAFSIFTWDVANPIAEDALVNSLLPRAREDEAIYSLAWARFGEEAGRRQPDPQRCARLLQLVQASLTVERVAAMDPSMLTEASIETLSSTIITPVAEPNLVGTLVGLILRSPFPAGPSAHAAIGRAIANDRFIDDMEAIAAVDVQFVLAPDLEVAAPEMSRLNGALILRSEQQRNRRGVKPMSPERRARLVDGIVGPAPPEWSRIASGIDHLDLYGALSERYGELNEDMRRKMVSVEANRVRPDASKSKGYLAYMVAVLQEEEIEEIQLGAFRCIAQNFRGRDYATMPMLEFVERSQDFADVKDAETREELQALAYRVLTSGFQVSAPKADLNGVMWAIRLSPVIERGAVTSLFGRLQIPAAEKLVALRELIAIPPPADDVKATNKHVAIQLEMTSSVFQCDEQVPALVEFLISPTDSVRERAFNMIIERSEARSLDPENILDRLEAAIAMSKGDLQARMQSKYDALRLTLTRDRKGSKKSSAADTEAELLKLLESDNIVARSGAAVSLSTTRKPSVTYAIALRQHELSLSARKSVAQTMHSRLQSQGASDSAAIRYFYGTLTNQYVYHYSVQATMRGFANGLPEEEKVKWIKALDKLLQADLDYIAKEARTGETAIMLVRLGDLNDASFKGEQRCSLLAAVLGHSDTTVRVTAFDLLRKMYRDEAKDPKAMEKLLFKAADNEVDVTNKLHMVETCDLILLGQFETQWLEAAQGSQVRVGVERRILPFLGNISAVVQLKAVSRLICSDEPVTLRALISKYPALQIHSQQRLLEYFERRCRKADDLSVEFFRGLMKSTNPVERRRAYIVLGKVIKLDQSPAALALFAELTAAVKVEADQNTRNAGNESIKAAEPYTKRKGAATAAPAPPR